MNANALKYGMIAALAGLSGCGEATAAAAKLPPATTSKDSVVTNADGSVTHTRTETKEYKDADGNVVGHETSTYVETTYGEAKDAPNAAETAAKKDGEEAKVATPESKAEASAQPAVATDSFLGLKFGEEVPGAEKAEDVPGDPALKVVKFTPAKKLAGFDDYFAYVTPKTHKLVKVCACAKEAVDGGTFGRRHYLVEALERRYRTWARLASFTLPYYTFDVAPDRGVSICLVGASDSYETVIAAWDDAAARLARDEYRELRDAAYRAAVEARAARIKDAESAF